MEHPEESLVSVFFAGVKLQAKVHITHGESLAFCQVLVERQVCVWVPDDDVVTMGGAQVLSGTFAVGKGVPSEAGRELQRTIMNLIRQAQGGTADLPTICQYLSHGCSKR